MGRPSRGKSRTLIIAAAMAGLGVSFDALALDTWTNATGTGTWSMPANWADGTIPFSNESILFPFPGPASPNVSFQVTPPLNSVQFDNSYQLDGFSMQVPTIGVAAGKTGTINAAISGGGGDFNKNGAGTLVLGGSNSFNAININAGALRVASDSSISTNLNALVRLFGNLEVAGTFSSTRPIGLRGGSINVLAGHTFTTSTYFDVGSDYNVAMTKDGPGTLVVTNWSSRSGPTFLNAGTLRIESNAQPGYGAISVASGATLELINKSYLYPPVNVVTGSTVRATGNVTNSIQLPSGGADVFPTISTGTSTSDLFNVSFTGTATSGSVINITGAGTVVPAFFSSYQGTLAVNGGTLRGGGTMGSGTSPIQVNNGGTVEFSFGGASRTYNLNNGSKAKVSGSFQPPVMNVASGAAVSLGAVKATDTMQITANNRLIGGASNAMIDVVGPGAVWVSGSQTYAGGWKVSAGALRVTGDSAVLGSGTSAVVVDGGMLELNGGVMMNRDVSLVSGTVASSGGGDVYLNGVTTVAPGANVSLTGSMFVGNGANDLTGGGPGTYVHINQGFGGSVFPLQPSNVVADWLIDGGTLYVTSDAQLGAATNTVTVNPFGTLRTGVAGAYARTLIASGGTLNNQPDVSWQNVTGSGLVKAGAGTLTVNQLQLGSLSVNAGAMKLAHTPASSATGEVSALTIVPSSRVDLTNNALIFRGTASSWNGSQYTGTVGLVAKGRNDGTWDGGGGIITSEPDALAGLTTLVAMTAAEAGIIGSFRGVSVAPGDTIVAYTWGGDANLDGELNGDDYFAIDSNVLQSGSVFGYSKGDFDYDGDIDGDDYFVIDSNILQAQNSTPFPTGAGLSSVPEPASLSLLSTLFLLKRRRHS